MHMLVLDQGDTFLPQCYRTIGSIYTVRLRNLPHPPGPKRGRPKRGQIYFPARPLRRDAV